MTDDKLKKLNDIKSKIDHFKVAIDNLNKSGIFTLTRIYNNKTMFVTNITSDEKRFFIETYEKELEELEKQFEEM